MVKIFIVIILALSVQFDFSKNLHSAVWAWVHQVTDTHGKLGGHERNV